MNLIAQTFNRGEALSREFARKTREVGLVATLKHALAKLSRRLPRAGAASSDVDTFDSTYGTDTVKMVAVWALDIPREKLKHANRYETIAPEVFAETLGQLKIAHEDFVFIDLGSGKGRALLLASRFPFKEIIGVELSARLHTVAEQNLQIFKDATQKCRRIRAICQDVTDYSFPDSNIVLYLYNPFDDSVMRTVVSKVEAFLRGTNRRVCVIYHHPNHREAWDQSKAFQALKTQGRCAIYASVN